MNYILKKRHGEEASWENQEARVACSDSARQFRELLRCSVTRRLVIPTRKGVWSPQILQKDLWPRTCSHKLSRK